MPLIRQIVLLVFMGIFSDVAPSFSQSLQKTIATGDYKVLLNEPHQYIWGLGFEIQSDAIASGNQGLPDNMTSVPHDLVPSERRRLSEEMLQGFRYCRVAGGLYYRGTTQDQKELRPRWDSQLLEIKSMLDMAGVEGLSLEYWSPAPFWKANGQYPQRAENDPLNKLKCFAKGFKNDPDYKGDTLKFLNDFGESLVHDIQYLNQNGLKVMFWGLQNEPPVSQTYSSCKYTPDEYYLSFKTIAPKIKAYNPNIAIIADSWKGPQLHSKKIAADPEARQYVDAWVWHQIGQNSNNVIEQHAAYLESTHGLPVFQNEYEYLQGGTSAERCLNTVQNMMNWFTFVDSPTWFWIHALKPTYNEEANGYSLGFWRPWDDEKTTTIEKGHWKYNNYNWFALAGFFEIHAMGQPAICRARRYPKERQPDFML